MPDIKSLIKAKIQLNHIKNDIHSENLHMSKLPDFTALNKFPQVNVDDVKAKLANIHTKVLRLAKLFELKGDTVLAFCTYFAATLRHKILSLKNEKEASVFVKALFFFALVCLRITMKFNEN